MFFQMVEEALADNFCDLFGAHRRDHPHSTSVCTRSNLSPHALVQSPVQHSNPHVRRTRINCGSDFFLQIA